MQVQSKGARLAGFAATLASAVLLVGGCSDATPTATDVEANFAKGGNGNGMGTSMVQIYEADLMPLNNSGVTGTARFQIVNGQFKAQVHAKGLTPGKLHPQHIHGFQERNSVCPPPTAQNRIPGLPEQAAHPDELIAVEEGLPFYGEILVPLDGILNTTSELSTFPVANPAGVVNYFEKTELTNMLRELLQPLEQKHVVLHGAFVPGQDGEPVYIATLPVACGLIRQVK